MSAALFVVLNITDAYLTKMGLMAGAVEVNPLMAVSGSSMLIKGLMAALLAFVLYYFGKERALWPLNFILFGIVLWNSATCCLMNLPPLLIGAHVGG